MAKRTRVVEDAADGRAGDKRKANWTLTVQAVKDIRDVFRNDAAVYRNLNTNAKTWGKVSNGEGVKRDTAREIAKAFVKFLRDFSDDRIKTDESEFDSDEARDLYRERYLEIAANKSYEDLLRRRP